MIEKKILKVSWLDVLFVYCTVVVGWCGFGAVIASYVFDNYGFLMTLEQDLVQRLVIPTSGILYFALAWCFAGTENAFSASTSDFFLFTLGFLVVQLGLVFLWLCLSTKNAESLLLYRVLHAAFDDGKSAFAMTQTGFKCSASIV